MLPSQDEPSALDLVIDGNYGTLQCQPALAVAYVVPHVVIRDLHTSQY